jgi:hypothetical protein
MQAPGFSVTLPPHLNKGFFWAVFVNQLECEPNIDFTVDERVLTFDKYYPAGTRVTFWYVFQAETTTSFEDAWFSLRGGKQSIGFKSVYFSRRENLGTAELLSVWFSKKSEAATEHLIEAWFTLRDTTETPADFTGAEFELSIQPELTAFEDLSLENHDSVNVVFYESEMSLRI